ncbi:MAG: hypothetical protein ACLQU5_20740, partial [Isosphaeraceae bacterium]
VRAAMVADPCESTWSSHRCHGAGHADPILDSFPEWEQLGRTEQVDAERCDIASSTHPTGLRPSPAGARPGSTLPLN